MPSQTNFSVVGNTVHIHPQPGSTINITVTPTSPGPLRFTFEFPGNSIHQWRNSIEADGSVVPDSEPARLEELERFNEQERNDTAVRYQSLVAAGVLANSPTPSPVKTFLNTLKHGGVFSPTPSPLKNFEDMLDRDPGHCSPVENLSAHANVRLREDSTTEDDTGDEAPVPHPGNVYAKDLTTEDDTDDDDAEPASRNGSGPVVIVSATPKTHPPTCLGPAAHVSATMFNPEMEDADDEMSSVGDSDQGMVTEDVEDGTQMLGTYSQLLFG